MADLSQVLPNWNADDVDPQGDFEVIPAGKYAVLIESSEMKTTSTGSGKYLELKMRIVRGQYQNRFLWARLNLINPNAKTVEIAKGQFSAICRAVDRRQCTDSHELHNIVFGVKVTVRKRKDNGEQTNEVKAFFEESKVDAPAEEKSSVWD